MLESDQIQTLAQERAYVYYDLLERALTIRLTSVLGDLQSPETTIKRLSDRLVIQRSSELDRYLLDGVEIVVGYPMELR